MITFEALDKIMVDMLGYTPTYLSTTDKWIGKTEVSIPEIVAVIKLAGGIDARCFELNDNSGDPSIKIMRLSTCVV